MNPWYLWILVGLLVVVSLIALVRRSMKRSRADRVAEFKRQVRQYTGRIWYNVNPNAQIVAFAFKEAPGFSLVVLGRPRHCPERLFVTSSGSLGRIAQFVYRTLISHDLWSSMEPGVLTWAKGILFERKIELYVPDTLEHAIITGDASPKGGSGPTQMEIETVHYEELGEKLAQHLIRIVHVEGTA